MIYIFSDDGFFSMGMSHTLNKIGIEAKDVRCKSSFITKATSNDIIISSVSSFFLQNMMTKLAELHEMKIINFIDAHLPKPSSLLASVDVLSKKITSEEFLYALSGMFKASNKPTIQLTETEEKVFSLLLKGKAAGKIAEKLGCSEKTVSAHKNHTLEKLGIKNLNKAAISIFNIYCIKAALF